MLDELCSGMSYSAAGHVNEHMLNKVSLNTK